MNLFCEHGYEHKEIATFMFEQTRLYLQQTYTLDNTIVNTENKRTERITYTLDHLYHTKAMIIFYADYETNTCPNQKKPYFIVIKSGAIKKDFLKEAEIIENCFGLESPGKLRTGKRLWVVLRRVLVRVLSSEPKQTNPFKT